MKRSHGSFFILVLIAVLSPAAVYADSIINLTFSPAMQAAQPGDLLTFTGTLGITGDPGAIFLNGTTVNTTAGFGLAGIDPPDPTLLMLDDLSFFLNAPLSISSDGLDGPSFSTFDFFTVGVGSLVAPGTYFGTFYVLGGFDAGFQDILASASFQIDVAGATPAPVPEPRTLVLLSTGILGIGAASWVRRRRRMPAE